MMERAIFLLILVCNTYKHIRGWYTGAHPPPKPDGNKFA